MIKLIIYFLIFYFFNNNVNSQASNATIRDITKISNDLYGDIFCYVSFDLLIENIDSGFEINSIVGHVFYSNPNLLYTNLLSNDKSYIYRVTFETTPLPNDGLGQLVVDVEIKYLSNQTSTILTAQYSYYCKQPPPISTIQVNKFILSADRLSMVTSLKVTNWSLKSNLPELNIFFNGTNEISFLEIKPFIGQDYYTITIKTIKSFLLPNKYGFYINMKNWVGGYDNFNFEIEGPLYSSSSLDNNILISQKPIYFYPTTSNFATMHIDNLLYSIVDVTSSIPDGYVYTISNSLPQQTMYSTLIGGKTGINQTRTIWLNPYRGFNYFDHSFTTFGYNSTNGLNFGDSPVYSVSSGYIQKQGTFLTPLTANISDNDKVLMVVYRSNDLQTDSMKFPITYTIFNNDGSNNVAYNHFSNVKFPYGISNPSPIGSSFFKTTILMSSYIGFQIFQSQIIVSSDQFAPTTQILTNDTMAPIVNNFKITSLGNGYFLIEASVSENNGSGFFEIALNTNNRENSLKNITLLSCANFKNGNVYKDSSYERIFKPTANSISIYHKFYVTDQNGNSEEIKQYFNFNDPPIIKIPSTFYESNNKLIISYFSFENQIVNLENDGVWNSAYLKFDISNTTMPDQLLFLYYPYFMLTPYKLNQNVNYYKPIPFFYNSTAKMYQVNFYIPSNLPDGNIDFKITTPFIGTEYYGSILANTIKSASLTAKTTNFKTKPPIVSYFGTDGGVFAIPIANTGTPYKLGVFIISFEESDLDHGFITFASSSPGSTLFVKRYLNISITPDQVLQDYAIPNSYRISFPLTCVDTTYEVIYAKFLNKQGYISEYSRYESLYSFTSANKESVPLNPFFRLLSDVALSTISTTCGLSTITTVNTITLTSLTISISSLNVGGSESYRQLMVNFTVRDTTFGIDTTQKPMVYLIGGLYGKDHLSFPSIVSLDLDSFITFSAVINVPYSYAYPNPIFIEIFGVMNKRGMINGWSSNDIENLKIQNPSNFSSSIISTVMVPNENTPIITSNIECYNNNNILTIYGFNLFSNSTVSRIFNSNDPINIVMAIISANGNSMEIQLDEQINQNFLITVRSIDGFKSNEYLVEMILNYSTMNFTTPTPSSTPSTTPSTTPIVTNTPHKCIGTPECGGTLQGYCSTSGYCICYSPYIGPSCGSKVVPIPPPIVNPTSPSFNLSTSSNNETNSESASLVGIISIVSIRELDYNNKAIRTFKFTSWELTKINEFENYYSTNIIATNSTNNEEITCKISVTTNWYETLTNISFAGQQLIMNPSTLKYTINITNGYPFQTKLNTLELVISAIAKTNSQDESACSNQEFGETSNDDNSNNYIQLTVDDKSLYGRFIKRGLVDNSMVSIQNVQLNDLISEDSFYISQSYIGVRIPFYTDNVVIDPDFSILVNSETTSSNCKNNSNSLSKGALIGIVVGCVGGAIIIVALLLLYIKYKFQFRNFKEKIIKLSKVKK